MSGHNVKPGDTVIRMMAGIPMPMLVTEVTDDLVMCGAWVFDLRTGAEIDSFLNWGPPPLATGSYLVFEKIHEA